MSKLTPKQKRQARITALQSIYAQELNGSDPDTTCEHMLDDKNIPSEGVLIYSKHLCNLTFKYISEIDNLIQQRSKNWDLSRITLMDKLILRMSISEMFFTDDIPPKVSITEGVEIAKVFSTNDSSGFVNGILDTI